MITRQANQPIEERYQMRGGKGTVAMQKLVSELPLNARIFSRITLVPGASIGYHVHENETELFYFVSGQGQVTDDSETVSVKAGDAMSTSSGHGHGVENTGADDLVILAAIVKD